MTTATCAVFAFFLSAAVSAEEMVDRSDLVRVFEDEGMNGSFALLDVADNRLVVVNAERVFQRFIPASTFKFANSLIALELGVIADENEIIPYGGEPQPFKAWEQDMRIGNAFAVSNVPVFQELARRVGKDRYTELLENLSYGNGTVGAEVERFWLDGPLKISAVEQVRFLAALATWRLPFSNHSQTLVHDISVIESRNNAILYGKTGWTVASDPGIGWFVGWVQNNDNVYAFALNMDMRSQNNAPQRVAMARRLLSELGVY
ncbi:class D beta-lactamase [Parasedimentitalea marina]|uniref:class D beta-lactamase n=1 Tax=Parasedimentitalea marina TaxID=2483033 RepID=UPI001EE8079F|nr:class D beta-lactamase [Parasedimentitalea marina]